MRFFEFKLPTATDPFIKDLESYLTKLINTAKSLPENDPRRLKFDNELGNLKQDLGLSEDNLSDADNQLVSAVVRTLVKEGESQALFALMNLEKIVNNPEVRAAIKNKEEQISKQEQERFREQSQVKLSKAKKIASRLGKKEDWANDLIAVLDRYDDEQLVNNFLDLVVSNSALTQNPITDKPILKTNLKNIINPSISKILENTTAFKNLALLPFSEQTAGFGGGVGPGEALLAMLIPNAKRASSSDLEIEGNGIWEVKAGGSESSKAWLDSSSASPSELYKIFRDQVDPKLKSMYRKKIRYSDGSVFTLSQVLDLSDFRDEKFKFLRTAFRYIDASTRKSVIDKIYEKLFPSIKKKDSKSYQQYVKNTVDSILEGNRKIVADLQAKLGMMEYSLGKYNVEGFIIYNYNSHELLIFRGLEGIISSIENKENMVKTETITMGSSKKSSAGVTLTSKTSNRRPKVYD